MAHAAGDAHEYPVYGYHYRLVFPLLDADGDLVTGATTPDSERSIDCGTFADCTNEMTEIATSSGMYYLDLTGVETSGKVIAVIAKSATAGMKTTPMTIYPRRLPPLESGTAQAGAAGTITLASGASAQDDCYNGLFVGITNDSPAGAQYQLRRIIDYVGSTKVATIDSNWGTNPSSASTYEILIPEGYDAKAWCGKKVADPTVAGVPEVDVTTWLGTAAATPTVAGVPEVDVTHWIGTAAATPDTAGFPKVTIKDGTGTGEIDTVSGRVQVTEAQIDQIVDEVLDEDMTAHQTQGTLGQAIGDPGADTDTIWGLANTNLDAAVSSRASAAALSTVQADTDDIQAKIGTPANLGGGATVAANLSDIEAQTDDIGAAGAGLTAVPWNAAWDAEVESEVSDALVAKNLDKLILASGTADSGSTTTMVDAARTEADADYWKGRIILFTSGVIAGQCAIIEDFNAGTDTFTFKPALTAAVTTQTYVILPSISVWDETLAEHLAAGTTGNALNAAGSAGDPWSTALPGAYGAGTAGKIVGDNINATVSSRASQASVDGVQADTDNIQTRLPAALVGGRMAANAEVVGDKTGYSLTTAEEDAVVDKVWDEARSGHVAAGSFGQGVASVQGNITGSVASIGTDGISAGSIAADALTAAKFAADVGNEFADALLNRDLSLGTDSGSPTVRTVRQALRFCRNRWVISGGTLTVYKEDDTTASWTGVVTQTAGDPVSQVDPASV